MWSDDGTEMVFTELEKVLPKSLKAGAKATFQVTFEHDGPLPPAKAWYALLWPWEEDLPTDVEEEDITDGCYTPTVRLQGKPAAAKATFDLTLPEEGDYALIVGYRGDDDEDEEGQLADFGSVTVTA